MYLEPELMTGVNPDGKRFVLYGDKQTFERWAAGLIGKGKDYESEFNIGSAQMDTLGAKPTLAEREIEEQKLQALINQITSIGWKEIFMKLPRKKDGSLYKNRIVSLWRGYTYQYYVEDNYAFNAPEIRLKALDDYKAKLQFGIFGEKI